MHHLFRFITASSSCSESCQLKDTYEYIETSKGIEGLADYPDVQVTQECAYDPKKAVAICSGYEHIAANEKELKLAVASIGPVSAFINTSPDSFGKYSNGVYNDPTCTATAPLVHAVLIVGYGTDPVGGDYWIVKNSWGTSWGMG